MNHLPQDLYYTNTHEWVRVEDNIAIIGITDHARELLGELVFVELPEVDESIKAGDEIGVVESVKAASDFYAPISGTIYEVNEDLLDSPNLVNSDPYGDGWLVKIKIRRPDEIDALLSPEDYQAELDEEE